MLLARHAFLVALLAIAGGAVATASSESSFRYEKGLLWIQVRTDASPESLTFLLDSGAEESIIDTRRAKKIGLKLGSRETVQTVSGRATAYRTESTVLKFADTVVRKPLLAFSLRSASRSCGRQIDGLLGADFFTGRIVQIDYGSKRIRLLKTPPRSATALPISMNYRAMCVPMVVDGTRLGMVRLDTGCDQALHWSTAALSKVEKAFMKKSTIGFSWGNVWQRKCALQLGSHHLGRFLTNVSPSPIFPGEDGLLGNRALSKYTVTIDMRNRRLVLEPRT